MFFKNYNFSKKYCDYSNKFKKTHSISIIKYFSYRFSKSVLYFKNRKFSISGRVTSKRVMGQSMFLHILDSSSNIQLYFSKKNFKLSLKNIINSIKLGDIIGVKGFLFFTKTNELTLNIYFFCLLSKCLNSFPDKRFGIIDKEICYRLRYLDLMVNKNTKKLFIIRSKIINFIRNFFLKLNYLEVETPSVQFFPGGADAKPFETYNDYFKSKMFFRISPELFLKKLIIGGYNKVFEIGKNFRNEGISTKHHPEFSFIEFYQAYSDYNDFIFLTEYLLKNLTKYIFGKYYFFYNNFFLDFSLCFKKFNFIDLISHYTGLNYSELFNKKILLNYFKINNLDFENNYNIFDFQEKLFEIFVEKNLISPTFVLHHPLGISPLSRKLDINKLFVERFELYIAGKEIANGFSELNDPLDQERRFKNQFLKNKSDFYDINYIDSLKYALPPTAGEGIGLDRLIMLYTNSKAIKDVILFPLMRE